VLFFGVRFVQSSSRALWLLRTAPLGASSGGGEDDDDNSAVGSGGSSTRNDSSTNSSGMDGHHQRHELKSVGGGSKWLVVGEGGGERGEGEGGVDGRHPETAAPYDVCTPGTVDAGEGMGRRGNCEGSELRIGGGESSAAVDTALQAGGLHSQSVGT
jgi:hypothetical protein